MNAAWSKWERGVYDMLVTGFLTARLLPLQDKHEFVHRRCDQHRLQFVK